MMELVLALHSFALAVRLDWIWHYPTSKRVAVTQGSKRTPGHYATAEHVSG